MKSLKYMTAIWLVPLALAAKVSVVTSTSDLAYFAKEIGGEFVEVSSIAPPAADIHAIEARPSYMIKVAKAKLVLKVGLELDLWMDPIIDGSRNDHLIIVDCSKYVPKLEVPSFKADARYGDLHRYGNPHYWLSPLNAEPITAAIVEGLQNADPDHGEQYKSNQLKLLGEISAAVENVRPKLEQLKGIPIIYYHNSWPYFNEFAGTSSKDFVEPYPGVAPSPTQIKKLIEELNSSTVKIIAMEPYFDKRVPEKIAAETGAKVVTLYPSIGGRNKEEDYEQWLDANISTLIEALP